MDSGTKLEELELTAEEVTRLSRALKDEKFRQMLLEYAEEISTPESKKRFEEEITQLEQDRGMHVQFVHPEPHHVLKTSMNGKEKCFINICSNSLINQPTCAAGRGEDGRAGQHWSLPYSLAPGRSDRDTKGNRCTTYDVVFHPETLYLAEKSSRFMKMVNSTAVQGVETAFKVQLDEVNVKVLKMRYKGSPQPAVLRHPIPGHQASPDEEPLPFVYPDPAPRSKPIQPTAAPPQEFQNTAEESSSAPGQPTQPLYTVKFRSVVDLQDYRCSRDSAPSPRPRYIIITVDLPLIKSAGDIDLDVTERSLVLESRTPAYKLELRLAYPVDADKGDAKFNKTKHQLTVALPVLPAEEPAVLPESDQEESEDGESVDGVEGDVREAESVASLNTEDKNDEELSGSSWKAQRLGDRCDQEIGRHFSSDQVELEPHCDPSHTSKAVDALSMCEGTKAETSRPEDISPGETEHALLSGPQFSSRHLTEEEDGSCSLREEEKNDSEPTAHSTAPPAAVPENVRERRQRAALVDVLHHEFSVAQPQLTHLVSGSEEESCDAPCDPNSSSQQPGGEPVVELSPVSSASSQVNSLLEPVNTMSSPEVTGTLLEGKVADSSLEQISPTPDKNITEEIQLLVKERVESIPSSERSQTEFRRKTPALLREKNPEDGREVIISDHTTSAAFTFQNSLRFELD